MTVIILKKLNISYTYTVVLEFPTSVNTPKVNLSSYKVGVRRKEKTFDFVSLLPDRKV